MHLNISIDHTQLWFPESDLDDAERLQPPKVIIPLSNIQLKEGETVLLIAKIDGYPKPKVTIYIIYF